MTKFYTNPISEYLKTTNSAWLKMKPFTLHKYKTSLEKQKLHLLMFSKDHKTVGKGGSTVTRSSTLITKPLKFYTQVSLKVSTVTSKAE